MECTISLFSRLGGKMPSHLARGTNTVAAPTCCLWTATWNGRENGNGSRRRTRPPAGGTSITTRTGKHGAGDVDLQQPSLLRKQSAHFAFAAYRAGGVHFKYLAEGRYDKAKPEPTLRRQECLSRSLLNEVHFEEEPPVVGGSGFVKNLENVQGDERDVIFFSTCNGADESGRRMGSIPSPPLRRMRRVGRMRIG